MKDNLESSIKVIFTALGLIAIAGLFFWFGTSFPEETYTINLLDECKAKGGELSVFYSSSYHKYIAICNTERKTFFDKTIN